MSSFNINENLVLFKVNNDGSYSLIQGIITSCDMSYYPQEISPPKIGLEIIPKMEQLELNSKSFLKQFQLADLLEAINDKLKEIL